MFTGLLVAECMIELVCPRHVPLAWQFDVFIRFYVLLNRIGFSKFTNGLNQNAADLDLTLIDLNDWDDLMNF